MKTVEIIEVIIAAIMPLSLLFIAFRTIKKNRGIGARVIQFLAIALLIPTIILLSLEDKLTSETTATLIGGLAGYVLSGISNYDNNKSDS